MQIEESQSIKIKQNYSNPTNLRAKSIYTAKKSEEKPYDEISPDMKMTKASVKFETSRDLTDRIEHR